MNGTTDNIIAFSTTWKALQLFGKNGGDHTERRGTVYRIIGNGNAWSNSLVFGQRRSGNATGSAYRFIYRIISNGIAWYAPFILGKSGGTGRRVLWREAATNR